MDILKKFTIPGKSLEAGNHHFEFDVDDRFFAAFEHSLVTAGKAKVEVDVEKAAAGLTLDFSISGEVETPCDRCLEPLTLPVDYEGTLKVRVGSEGREHEYDGEVMWIPARDEDIELAQYIYESICLSLPMACVHGEDANGVSLCDPDMMARFKIVSQSEFDAMAPKDEEPSPMQKKLEELKKEMK